MHKCLECEKEFKSIIGLSRHWKRTHKLDPKDLYLKIKKTNIPLCKCGCNQETKFLGIERGFSEFIHGHHIRLENPHIHRTDETFKKISKTRIEMHENGDLSPWNKGITATEDERLKIQGERASKTISSNKKELEKRSHKMKEQWKDKNIVPLLGEDHSNWKGGTSTVSSRCHANRRLYQEWKYPRLEDAGFKCTRCGSTDSLEVHHDKEKMSEIIHLMTERWNPEKKNDFELQTDVMNAVIDYHIQNDVSGEVICHECHKTEHPSYNYKK